ncbi:MAG: hypothetical protein KDA28_11400, partial [Phycisphaerales bacterium]|nr:hypothetical protein [Phycisphaerales bacterium]
MPIDDLIPSMFHRRLLMLGACFTIAVVPLGIKVGVLTLVKGDDLRAAAEERLLRRTWIPTHRGRILDRKGRVLAMDRAVYDVRVEFGSITGEWARDAAWSH